MLQFRTLLSATALLAACASGDGTAAPQNEGEGGRVTSTQGGMPFKVDVVADFDSPWAMTFLPDGRMLVTEKDGRLRLVTADGQTTTFVTGVPAVDSEGQGGLMDVVLSPGFARDRLVYLSASQTGPGGKGVVLMRAKLVETQVTCVRAPCPPQARLDGLATIFRGTPFVDGSGHYSGRIAFSPDGKYLFFTNGERQKFTPAQDPQATLGKVLRLLPDGRPAPGNPLAAKGFHPAVWSYGHRNLLGIAFDAQGNLWEQEMGPKGGDELNLVLPGRNYGYPLVSDGDHYDGRPIPDHDTRPDLEKYKVNWTPVISPAGLMIYSGAMFPQWRGDAFIGGLSSQALIRVDLDGTAASKGDQWPLGTRIREVEQGPDGAIWLLEDGLRGAKGRLMKLTKAG